MFKLGFWLANDREGCSPTVPRPVSSQAVEITSFSVLPPWPHYYYSSSHHSLGEELVFINLLIMNFHATPRISKVRVCCSYVAIDSICTRVKKHTWILEASMLAVCCFIVISIWPPGLDYEVCAGWPVWWHSQGLGQFHIYGPWIFCILLIQDNLPLVDVLSEDSCGPGTGKP